MMRTPAPSARRAGSGALMEHWVPAKPHLEDGRERAPRRWSPRSAAVHDRDRASVPSRNSPQSTCRAGCHADIDQVGAGVDCNARAYRHRSGLAASELDNVHPDTLRLHAAQHVAPSPRQTAQDGVGCDQSGAKLRHGRRRYGRSVIPDIGARKTRFSMIQT